MSKLYVFAIGGTGSRVLRSFTMLMAAGVKLGNDISKVVPVIIDPDQSNADLTRAISLMNMYQGIRKQLTFSADNPNQFFRTEIGNMVKLDIAGTNDKKFCDFVGLSTMDPQSEAMMRMLFSEKNLDSSMDVGFKGNPNIGSVVLNQIIGTAGFNTFAESFQQGDYIFIISSIFGGTGASGFPLLLKTMRYQDNFPNFANINSAAIGAVSVLPYFNIKSNDKSEIDSSTFVSKTISAMAYYENNIVKDDSLNALYYLADEASANYDNHEGGNKQKNDAHLIEFLAATSIVDFTHNPNKPQDGSPITTSNREYGVNNDEVISFSSFSIKDRNRLYGPLTQFVLLSLCLTDQYKWFTSEEFNSYNLKTKDFLSTLKGYCEEYRRWLVEMKGNKRSLDLFNLSKNVKPAEVVTGVKAKKGFFGELDYTGRKGIANFLNKNFRECKSNGEIDKCVEMYYRGTKEIFDDKFKK